MFGVKGRRFILFFKYNSTPLVYKKMSVYDRWLANKVWISNITVASISQDGGESQLASKLRHSHRMYYS